MDHRVYNSSSPWRTADSRGNKEYYVAIHETSLTRVQPLFKQLYRRDPSGIGWLTRLLSMGSRVPTGGTDASADQDPGSLRLSPQFEVPVASPRDYLKTLVASRERLLEAAATKDLTKLNPLNREKRERLMRGEPATLKEAQKFIEADRLPGKGKWWILEGLSKINCVLLSERTTIFIDGRRTEIKLTEHVFWDPRRNQVFRNLDCLRSLCSPGISCYLLLVVEKGTELEKAAAALDQNCVRAARDSWPHLDRAAGDQLLRRYLGFTTWQDIAVGLQEFVKIQYPDTSIEAHEKGLCGPCEWV
jgi:hypothetical protein